MTKLKISSGYFKNGIPYACFGTGTRNLIIFDGLDFEHKPPSGMQLKMICNSFRGAADDFKIYIVSRKKDLLAGYTMRDMADDYAVMVKKEFGVPVDIMGISTGGVIAQHFAADHSELVHCLVLAMTGYILREEAKQLQRRVGILAQEGRWGAAYSTLITGVYPRGIRRALFQVLMGLFGMIGAPASASDGVVEIEAEEKHDFKERLSEIKVPTLVIGGEDDFFYPIRETAEGIPDVKMVLYPGFGHNALFAHQRAFFTDVLAFLNEHRKE
jgi:pimeloyl-ACP methyl ester carboxylesterase